MPELTSDKQVDGEGGKESQVFNSRDLEIAENKSVSGGEGKRGAGLHYT